MDPLTGLEHADVLEIGRSTSPAEAKTNLDRLKQAYGVFFATSAQRAASKYGNVFGLKKNPIFDDVDDEGINLKQKGDSFLHSFVN